MIAVWRHGPSFEKIDNDKHGRGENLEIDHLAKVKAYLRVGLQKAICLRSTRRLVKP